LLLPPPEPLLEPDPEPLLEEPDPGPEPLPAAPLAPLVPPLWPCVLSVAAAPVLLLFFFDLWVEEAVLSALPEADASLVAVCIDDELPLDEPLMPLVPLVPLLEDLLDLLDLLDLPELELLEVSLGIELLPPEELVLLPMLLGLLVLEPMPPVVPAVPACDVSLPEEPLAPMLELPLPLLEPLPLEP